MLAFINKYNLPLVAGFIWSALICWSLYTSISNFEEHSILLAKKQASDYWDKDQALRKWVTRHGGLYVKPDKRTPPNRLLAHLPHRDVETTDGMRLTLMNPAYMMRQIAEEYEHLYGIKGKITAQVLLDPKGQRNKPDVWELESLKKFDQGEVEVSQVSQIDGASYLRYMRPMVMTKGCVLCHGHLGFKVGDIRGGVSVSIPLAAFESANTSSLRRAVIDHIIVWAIGLLVFIYFIVSQKKLKDRERQAVVKMNQSQRLNALGMLAGGIAHDYNNMLGIILGYGELLQAALKDQPRLLSYVESINEAGERNAVLTKKLLNFSKDAALEAAVVDINAVLNDQMEIFEKILTPRVQLKYDLAYDLWDVWLDRNELVNVLVNIIINAQHAAGQGGEVVIRTENRCVTKLDGQRLNLVAGDYVLLSISDDGCGMDEEDRQNVFEPFYSTKGEDSTGLGLTQAYGFAESSGGKIDIYSEINHGCQVVLHFPRHTSFYEEDQQIASVTPSDTDQSATILIVDDEPALLEMVSEILKLNGYTVLCAESGHQALELMESNAIDILLSDILMPQMDGYELAAIVRDKYPVTKVLLMSGASEAEKSYSVDDASEEQLLHKPVKTKLLLERLKLLQRGGSLEWSDKYSIGVDQIDEDHKILVSLYNDCLSITNSSDQDKNIPVLLDRIFAHTVQHFKREEMLMKVCDYPKLEAHQHVHQGVLTEIDSRIRSYGLGKLDANQLLNFISNWLIDHIVTMDRDIEPYCKGKKSRIDKAFSDSTIEGAH